MIKDKKGLALEALLRITIAVVLAYIAIFHIGKPAAEAAFGSNDASQSFDRFVNEINSLQEGPGKQSLVDIDEGTALIGFTKNGKEFRCYVCDQVYAFSSNIPFYSIQKPANEQCNGKACVCLCLKGLSKSQYVGQESKINCQQFSCKSLNNDLYNKISLESALKKKGIQIATYPYWENGFFFVRRKNTDTPLNGMIPPNDDRKISLFIEKKSIGTESYVAACPSLPCIQ